MWEMTRGRYPETTQGMETDSQNPSENQLKFWGVLTPVLCPGHRAEQRSKGEENFPELSPPAPPPHLPRAGAPRAALALLWLQPQALELLQFALVSQRGGSGHCRSWSRACQEPPAKPGQRGTWREGKQSPALPQPAKLPGVAKAALWLPAPLSVAQQEIPTAPSLCGTMG